MKKNFKRTERGVKGKKWGMKRISCPFLLKEKETKSSRPTSFPARGQPKDLSLRSRSGFCETKRQAPLREAQDLSPPLATAARMSAVACPPDPVKGRRSRSRRFYSRLQQAPQGMSSLRRQAGEHGIYALQSRYDIYVTLLIISNKSDNK